MIVVVKKVQGSRKPGSRVTNISLLCSVCMWIVNNTIQLKNNIKISDKGKTLSLLISVELTDGLVAFTELCSFSLCAQLDNKLHCLCVCRDTYSVLYGLLILSPVA